MSAAAHRERGRRHLRLGQVRPAVDALCAALALEPDDAFTHALLAHALLRMQRVESASMEVERALAGDPTMPFVLLVLGEVRQAQRRWGDAEAAYRAGLGFAPDDEHLHAALARLLMNMGKNNAALPVLEEARALAPESAYLHALLATCLLDVGRPAEAEAVVREALALEPEDSDALVVMGRIHLLRKEPDQAWDCAVHVLRANPDDRDALFVLTGVQAARSPFLGLWWKLDSALVRLGPGRLVVVLAAGVIYQLIRLLAEDFGPPGLDQVVVLLWLILCGYMIAGPMIFRRRLLEAIRPVGLDPRY